MSLLHKIKYCFKFKDLYLAPIAVENIINWPDYFIDFLSMTRKKMIVFKMKNSLKYLVRANTWDRGVITRIHLADEYNINQLSLSPESTVIDIGAHIGIFSVFVSKKAKKIFAFEPVSENFDLLKQNIQLNNLEDKINIFNVAVSDKKETLKIYLSKINTAGHSIYKNSDEYTYAQTVTLQEIFDKNSIEICDLLKIDTEGSEYKILFGLPQNYFKRIKRIHLEHHKIISTDKRYTRDYLKRLLEDKGFNISIDNHIMFAYK